MGSREDLLGLRVLVGVDTVAPPFLGHFKKRLLAIVVSNFRSKSHFLSKRSRQAVAGEGLGMKRVAVQISEGNSGVQLMKTRLHQ